MVTSARDDGRPLTAALPSHFTNKPDLEYTFCDAGMAHVSFIHEFQIVKFLLLERPSNLVPLRKIKTLKCLKITKMDEPSPLPTPLDKYNGRAKTSKTGALEEKVRFDNGKSHLRT